MAQGEPTVLVPASCFFLGFLAFAHRWLVLASLFLPGSRDPELFAELWRACAGPLVELPQTDERVFYFLQGHLEQVSLPLSLHR